MRNHRTSIISLNIIVAAAITSFGVGTACAQTNNCPPKSPIREYAQIFSPAPVFDVSGKPGIMGKPGRIGTSGDDGVDGGSRLIFKSGSNGTRGHDGTDAGLASRGQNAGLMELYLSRPSGESLSNFSGLVEISGILKSPEDRIDEFAKTFQVGPSKKLSFIAKGGDGGPGGKGGAGGSGGRGGDGQAARDKESAGSGGNGGDGGNGGLGTSGANGGKGGSILLKVTDENMDLLKLATQMDVRGGVGGAVGVNGSGGPGGAKGSGGSGSIRYGEFAGSDGSEGSRGADGNAVIHSGKPGAPGEFKIQVLSSQGEAQYSKIYDLGTSSFKIDSPNHDEIFEPSESGILHQLRVQNTGGMPTPVHQPIALSIRDGNGLRSRGEVLRIGQSLKAEEEYTVPGQLNFDLRDVDITNPGDRFSTTEEVTARAVQTGVDLPYENFERPLKFEITFPVEMTPIQVPTTLLAGQTAPIFWKVKNISTKPLGLESPSKRRLSTSLRQKAGPNTTDEFEFRTPSGDKISLDRGFLSAISELPPQKEIIVEGRIKIKRTALPYTKVHLQTELDLGRLQNPDLLRPVQFREITIHITRQFRKTPGSNILLVTNDQSNPEEIRAWNEMLSKLGLVADIWDISYEGFLDFSRELGKGSPSLQKEFQNSLVIVLNNGRPSKMQPTEEQTQSDELISKRSLLQSAAASQLHYYFVGKDEAHYERTMPFFLLPSPEKSSPEFKSIDEFKKGMVSGVVTNHLGKIAQIRLEDRYVASDPKPEDIKAYAKKVAEQASKLFPGRRLYSVHRFMGLKQENLTLGSRYLVGDIDIYESIPSTSTAMTAVAVPDDQIHRPDFVNGERNLRGLLLALPLQKKLDLFTKYAQGKLYSAEEPADRKLFADAIQRALISDILIEYRALSESRFEGSEDETTQKLTTLNEVLRRIDREINAHLENTTDRAKKAAELLLNFYAQAYFLFQSEPKSGLRTAIMNSISEAMKQKFSAGSDLAAKRIFDTKVKAFPKSANAVAKYLDETRPVGFVSDSQMDRTFTGRVRSQTDYERLMQGLPLIEKKQKETEEAAKKERSATQYFDSLPEEPD